MIEEFDREDERIKRATETYWRMRDEQTRLDLERSKPQKKVNWDLALKKLPRRLVV